jgi:hypothetical protein
LIKLRIRVGMLLEMATLFVTVTMRRLMDIYRFTINIIIPLELKNLIKMI